MDGEKGDGVIVGVFTHEEYHTVLDALDLAWKRHEERGHMSEARKADKLWEAMRKVLTEETENDAI